MGAKFNDPRIAAIWNKNAYEIPQPQKITVIDRKSPSELRELDRCERRSKEITEIKELMHSVVIEYANLTNFINSFYGCFSKDDIDKESASLIYKLVREHASESRNKVIQTNREVRSSLENLLAIDNEILESNVYQEQSDALWIKRVR